MYHLHASNRLMRLVLIVSQARIKAQILLPQIIDIILTNYERQPRVTQNAIPDIIGAHYLQTPHLTVKLLSYRVT